MPNGSGGGSILGRWPRSHLGSLFLGNLVYLTGKQKPKAILQSPSRLVSTPALRSLLTSAVQTGMLQVAADSVSPACQSLTRATKPFQCLSCVPSVIYPHRTPQALTWCCPLLSGEVRQEGPEWGGGLFYLFLSFICFLNCSFLFMKSDSYLFFFLAAPTYTR